MRTSLLKVLAISVAASLAGAALAAPMGGYGPSGGGPPSGGYAPSGGGPNIWVAPGGAPPNPGGVGPHGGVSPPGGYAPKGYASPPSGYAPKGVYTPPSGYERKENLNPPSGGPQFGSLQRHQDLVWLRRHHHGRSVFIAPGVFGYDYFGNGDYYYDDSDCWVYRRVYNRYGKFVGWQKIYVCEGDE